MITFQQSPADKLDYTYDWSAFLDGDTISTSAWTISCATGENPIAAITATPSQTATTAGIWVDNGTLGQIYIFSNAIVTAGGREATRAFGVRICPPINL